MAYVDLFATNNGNALHYIKTPRCRLFLKERLSIASIGAVLLMVAGVLAAVQPWQATRPQDGYKYMIIFVVIFATVSHTAVSPGL